MPSDTTHTSPFPLAPRAGPMSFAALFAMESLARALISTVISVQAYDLLRSSQAVSQLFFVVALASLSVTLSLPLLHQMLPRRWVYSLGVMCLILACLCLASFTLTGQVTGMFLRVVGTAILNITLAVYILDHIRKSDLVRSEPLRLTLSTLSWTIGPFVGIWLYQHIGPWAPQAASIAGSVALLAAFWYLRLTGDPIIRPGKGRAVNPLRNVGRFACQPRLRLAWLIAFGRSCFWSSLFIYSPILLIEGGLGKEAGGLLVSAGNAVLVFAVLFGRLAERVGVRIVIAGSFATIAAASIGAGVAGLDKPLVAALLLWIASIAAASLDGVGGIPYLRAVKPYERAEMTAVYRTYNDGSDLIPSMVFAVALSFFDVNAIFIILGLWLAVVGAVSWLYLPRSM